MKTVVYQSYRTTGVPPWVARCLATVRDWALSQGYDYRFLDDRLFDYVPAWYRRKVADNMLLVTDLARLFVARELLSEGFGRTIWVDADVLVFAPRNFRIDLAEGYAFCREFWIDRAGDGRLTGTPGINNAVSVFVAGNTFLDFYIDACQRIVRTSEGPSPLAVSTHFLSGLHRVMPLESIPHVGLFSPIVMRALTHAPAGPTLRMYERNGGSPAYAANLCSSFRNRTWQGVLMEDGLYERAVGNLLEWGSSPLRGDPVGTG